MTRPLPFFNSTVVLSIKCNGVKSLCWFSVLSLWARAVGDRGATCWYVSPHRNTCSRNFPVWFRLSGHTETPFHRSSSTGRHETQHTFNSSDLTSCERFQWNLTLKPSGNVLLIFAPCDEMFLFPHHVQINHNKDPVSRIGFSVWESRSTPRWTSWILHLDE